MTDREILHCIDKGADFYLSLFGWARHMETMDNGLYTYLRPKTGKQGMRSVYDIRLNGVDEEKRREAIAEIRALQMPVRLSIEADDELYRELLGKEKPHGPPGEKDEVYMAMLPEELPEYPAGEHRIDRMKSSADFAMWSMMTDNLFFGGQPFLHPIYHYPLCQSELVTAYILCVDGVPAAVAAVADDLGAASLELVGTQPEYRGQGLAKELCRHAVSRAFADGAKILTLRAKNARAARLFASLGFKAYDYLP